MKTFDHDFEPTLPALPSNCPQCTRALTDDAPFCACGFDIRYGSIKRLKSGRCIYCGYEGKLSAEHIFGDWLRRRYNKPAHMRKHRLSRPVTARFFEKAEIAEGLGSLRKAQPYAEVVYNVCADCNNNWMSDVHKAAAPIVSKLADGVWPKLSDEEAFALSRWVAMITINLESQGRVTTITDDHKSELMSGKMPPGWSISVGRMLDPNSGADAFHRGLKLPVAVGEDFVSAQISYFCVENVAFSAVSTVGPMLFQLLKYSGVPQQLLPRSIWPECQPPLISNKVRLTRPLLDDMMDQMFSPFDSAQAD